MLETRLRIELLPNKTSLLLIIIFLVRDPKNEAFSEILHSVAVEGLDVRQRGGGNHGFHLIYF